jgi:transcriptional antiterminator RfaH
MSFWTVVQTESQREHVAVQFLKQANFETYLPKIRLGLRERVAPLFPGYLFVEIGEQWGPVRWTAGVVRLLMVNDRPAAVPDRVVDLIREREDGDGLIALDEAPMCRVRELANGDPVRILRGSFEGRLGVYQGHSGAQRARILLKLLGGEVPVLVPSADVARAG